MADMVVGAGTVAEGQGEHSQTALGPDAGTAAGAGQEVELAMCQLAELGARMAPPEPGSCPVPGAGVLVLLAAGRVATEAEIVAEESRPVAVECPGPAAVRAAMRFCRARHLGSRARVQAAATDAPEAARALKERRRREAAQRRAVQHGRGELRWY